MFTTIIVQPIFNLLVFIYAILPGHNFGLAIIIFTVLVRLLLWPLVKKQIRQAKAMRELAPELKKIKIAAKGDKQKESKLTMELYKEKEINPFASIGIIIVQFPILIGLYIGLKKIIDNPDQIITFSYSFMHHLGWMQTLAGDIHRFDDSLFGLVNLTRTALGPSGIYWPAMIIVAASALAQFFQTKQLMPQSKESRSLRKILSEAGKGQSADQQEVNAAVSQGTLYIMPLFVLLVAVHLAVALPLYWLVSSAVAYVQQARALKEDVIEAEETTDKPKKETKASISKTAGATAKRRPSGKRSSHKRRKR